MADPTSRSESPAWRRVIGAVSGYGAAMVISRVASLVTLPLVSWAITPADLGTFAVLNSLLLLGFALLLDLGLDAAALRLAVDRAPAGQRDTFTVLLVARTAASLALAGLLLVAREPISVALTGTAAHAPLVPWLALSVVVGTPARTLSNWLRFRGRHGALGGVLAVMGLLENALLLVLVLGLDRGLEGLVIARVGSHVLTLPWLMALSRDLVGGRPRWRLLGPLLAFGAPFGLFSALHALREVDRYLIGSLASMAHAGVYDIAVRVAAPLAIANFALAMALEPELYRRHAAPQTPDRVVAFTRTYAWLGGSVAFAGAVLAPEIVLLVAPDFRPAALVIPLLLHLEVVEGVRRMAGVGGDLSKRTRLWAVVAVVNVLVAIPGAILLLPRWPYLGAPVSLLAGATLAALTAHALARRVHTVSLPVVPALGTVLGGAAVAWLAAAHLSEGALGLAGRIALALVYPFAAALVLEVRPHTVRMLLAARLAAARDPER